MRPWLTALLWLGLVSAAAASPDDLVGGAAPPIRARALDAPGEIGLDAYAGRPVVLAFVATWCRSCRRVVPALDTLAAESRDVAVIALSHEPRRRLQEHPWPHAHVPLLQCTGRTAVQYEASAVPTLVLLDRERRVRFAGSGASALRGLRRALTDLR